MIPDNIVMMGTPWLSICSHTEVYFIHCKIIQQFNIYVQINMNWTISWLFILPHHQDTDNGHWSDTGA